ncbi:MAG: chromosome partitioning protein ParB [Elusimicrobia bacterium HGW-Elusimicrobia-2]|nr:MAG: chromosome partitioning protein ParB [Elusimicrobia bacterium HGW-Elusimicrobia-2]
MEVGKMKKAVLGRGLKALIPEKEEGRIHMISVSEIQPGTHQARKSFNADSITSLAETLKQDGIIQPLVVSPSGTGWKLIAGERRLRAAKIAGFKKVPVTIKDTDEASAAFISLIENLQREDLNPLDEASGLEALMKKFSLTQEAVAERVGKSRSTVANTLRLLKFPEDIVLALGEGKISEGHARALSIIKDPRKRKHIIHRIINEHLSVREIEFLSSGKKTGPKSRQVSAEIREIAEKLESSLSTKVEVKANKKNQGHIKIHFFSSDELDRLIKRLSR